MSNERNGSGTLLLRGLCAVILGGGGVVVGFVLAIIAVPQAGYEFGYLEYMMTGAQVGLVVGVVLGVIVGARLTPR